MRRILSTFVCAAIGATLYGCASFPTSAPVGTTVPATTSSTTVQTTAQTTVQTTVPTEVMTTMSPAEAAFEAELAAFWTTHSDDSAMRETASMRVKLESTESKIGVTVARIDFLAERDLSGLYYHSSLTYHFLATGLYAGWVLVEPSGDRLLKVECQDEFLTTTAYPLSPGGLADASGEGDELSVSFPGAIVTASDAGHYRLLVPLSSVSAGQAFRRFVEAFGLSAPDPGEDAEARIDFTFSADSSALSIDIAINRIEIPDADMSDDEYYYYDYAYAIVVAYPETVTRFAYDSADYYVYAPSRIEDALTTYAEGDGVQAYLRQGRDNWIGMHLTPGYYALGHVNADEFVREYVLDGDGTRIERNPAFFRVEAEGDYWFNARVIVSDKYTIAIEKVPEADVGTIAEPIIDDDGYIDGAFESGLDESDAVLLDVSGKEGYYVLSGVDYGGVSVSVRVGYNGFAWNIGIGHGTFLPVIEGQPVILSLSAHSKTFAYRIAVDFVPSGPAATDYAQMPEMAVVEASSPNGSTPPVAMLGPTYPEVRFRFTVTVAGNYALMYNILWNMNVPSYDRSIPAMPLFTASGELVAEDLASSWVYLEPGDYYIVIAWQSGGYALLRPLMIHMPE
ncbi:MAG: hypothetical protein WC509_04675 [Candidatus Izemoplasmatales bacterium]